MSGGKKSEEKIKTKKKNFKLEKKVEEDDGEKIREREKKKSFSRKDRSSHNM